ncbi:MAG: sulfite exporter TauE/SafE family protein [Deltaproteobacteria bacterium]|nr:sulfite exporter TauE/SafE family protein [Deltaproteobacteria bacterium]
MYFATAGIELPPWLPPLVSFLISFFTSMGGVSGAFLLLPFQMSFLGYTSPSVSATNQLFNVVAIPSGVYRYYREGRMVWPLVVIVVIGTLPGVFIGAVVRILYLPDPRDFKLFAAAVLLYIGLKMIRDLVRKDQTPMDKGASERAFHELITKYHGLKSSNSGAPLQKSLPRVQVTHFTHKRLGYTFYGEQFDIPFWGIFALSFIVGIVGGIYGIGGGAIIAPFFVTFFRLPIYTVAGASLMGTFVTSVAGVLFYQALAFFYPSMSLAPDWLLGTLFGLGGMVGIYLGARCQKFVPAGAIKWMLAGIIMFTAVKYAVGSLGL